MQATIEQPISNVPEKLYSVDDLARLFGVSRWTIINWHRSGELPPGFRRGHTQRWTPDEIAHLFAPKRGV